VTDRGTRAGAGQATEGPGPATPATNRGPVNSVDTDDSDRPTARRSGRDKHRPTDAVSDAARPRMVFGIRAAPSKDPRALGPGKQAADILLATAVHPESAVELRAALAELDATFSGETPRRAVMAAAYDVIRDLVTAVGRHTSGCYRYRRMMNRHAETIVKAQGGPRVWSSSRSRG